MSEYRAESLESRLATAVDEEAGRELARRSISAALAYFVVTITLALASPLGQSHPRAAWGATIIALVVGLARAGLGWYLRGAPGPTVARWSLPFRGLILVTFVLWGLFTAFVIHEYQFRWTGMAAVCATAALLAASTTSLAPAYGFGRLCLSVMVVPAMIMSVYLGGGKGYTLLIFGALYLAFLFAQIKENALSFKAATVAAAREATRSANETYLAALAAAQTGIGLVDHARQFVHVNRQLCGLLGRSHDELIGRPVVEFLPQFSFPSRNTEAAACADTEYEHSRADGEAVWLSLTVVASRQGWVIIANDVTDRKREEFDRVDIAMRLSQAQKLESVGVLAGGIAHDFNNLLAVISGYGELALKQPMGESSRASIREILRASDRAATLTRRLLAFGRRQVLEPQPTDVNELLLSMEPLLSRTVGEATALQLDLSSDPQIALVDAAQMEQVFVNLALNARDAMPSGGHFTIRTFAGHDDAVHLTFADDGAGMTADTQSRAFEPFFSTKSLGDGSGLGLASVHGIITQSGGTILLESEIDSGTSFHIALPRSLTLQTERGADSREAVPPPRAPAAPGTILVVEDEASLRRLVSRILKDAGYAVLSAENGSRALELTAQVESSIDLLLTDVVLPGIDGKNLASQLAQRRPETRVLFMSGYSEERIQIESALGGGVRLLRKPFSAQVLLHAVSCALADPVDRRATSA